MKTNQDSQGSTRYRLEIEGEIAEEWSGWFEADNVSSIPGKTTLELTVADQAALHGFLKRIHTLHLRLISLTRIN